MPQGVSLKVSRRTSEELAVPILVGKRFLVETKPVMLMREPIRAGPAGGLALNGAVTGAQPTSFWPSCSPVLVLTCSTLSGPWPLKIGVAGQS